EGTVYFSNFTDQALYRQDGAGTPTRITPAPLMPLAQRYADGRVTPDGKSLVCVRESHLDDGTVINEIVVLPTDGSSSPAVIASGYDFYSTPRISSDGNWLAWLCWNHPLMPWDGTELWVAPLETGASLGAARQIAGGPQESIIQPEWNPEGILHFVSDRSNWWNLYREIDDQIDALAPMAAEFGGPQWVFGMSRYTFLGNGHIACIYKQGGFDYLGVIEPGEASVTSLPCAFTSMSSLSTDGTALWLIGASPTQGPTVLRIDPTDGRVQEVQRAAEIDINPLYISTPEAIEFPTENDKTAHAFYCAPTNPDYAAPDDELPPLLVITHGGPTGATEAQLSLVTQYWTSRGFGVVDVNYGGSSGYGREYRERLRGAWGIVDVEDCINAAQFLISQGRADPKRIGIRGGSAGGYTTLRALTWKQFFAVGASYFGLAELEAFVHDTHKFESRYGDGLIGPYPEYRDRYFDRSPVNFTDKLNCPLILFQGLEDKIVPPSQAEIMVAALKSMRMPYAYIAYEGEQHGFRKAENIIRSA
ncbi:MAG: prolyl oligopeptidase family serine peptidase, partial [Anaerolineae bacterium]|nr:prolyl oligopeptidase family serine peptidase [Anaerolineae bacterium]